MPSPEKILLFGRQGTGKTYQIIKTAQWLAPSGAQFYVADSDDSYERSLEAPEFKGKVPNLHVTFVYGWNDYTKWVDNTKSKIVPFRDWMVVDRADKAWRRVQEWYGKKAYGKDLADLMAANKQKRQMVVSPFDQADWLVINSEYFAWSNSILYEFRANIILACAVDKVQDRDAEETKNLYSTIGVNPSGQKEIAHEPHTVIFFEQDAGHNYHARTIKDRGGRTYFLPGPGDLLVAFPQQYLMMRAGWTERGPAWSNG
ncbi:MAG: ATP-binding protein, partial [bacterium]|nr:ATP-binding protein [bacterium]